MKKTILILTGTGKPAIAAANIYAEAFRAAAHNVHVIENRISPTFVLRFFWHRLKRFGLWHTLGTFLLRLKSGSSEPMAKLYEPDTAVYDINRIDAEFLARLSPDVVIANACALLDSELIATLKSLGAQIINVHNGLNPRYRGTGNVWAFYERNLEMTGVTVHHLDEGIDTGQIIYSKRIDFVKLGTAFEATDIEAFKAGARLAVEFVLSGGTSPPHADGPRLPVRSKAYTYPGYGEYYAAQARYEAACASHLPAANEITWLESFRELADQEDRGVFARQHWGDASSVVGRDRLVRELVDLHGVGDFVIDVGCGDGRYSDFWPEATYVGCDYSLKTMAMRRTLLPAAVQDTAVFQPNASVLADDQEHRFVEAAAARLPLQSSVASTVLAIGLAQHIDNTGALADEIVRILKSRGLLVINTLRQPSKLELVSLFIVSLFKPQQRKFAWAMWRQDYFSGKVIGNTKLARRYSLAELKMLFAPEARVNTIRYHGLFGTRLLSREITIVFKKR